MTRGAELDGDLVLGGGAALGGAYTFLEARDGTRLALTGRHRHQGHVRLTWGGERLGLRANLRGAFYGSWIVARGAAETIAPRFSLWDVHISKRLIRNLSAYLAIDNLTDDQDPNAGVLLPNGSPAPIYRPEAGRSVRVGARWMWRSR